MERVLTEVVGDRNYPVLPKDLKALVESGKLSYEEAVELAEKRSTAPRPLMEG